MPPTNIQTFDNVELQQRMRVTCRLQRVNWAFPEFIRLSYLRLALRVFSLRHYSVIVGTRTAFDFHTLPCSALRLNRGSSRGSLSHQPPLKTAGTLFLLVNRVSFYSGKVIDCKGENYGFMTRGLCEAKLHFHLSRV